MKLRYIFLIGMLTFLGFSNAQNKNIQIFITISEECPVCKFMTKTLKEMEVSYRNEVGFTLVFPTSMSNYKSIYKFKEKYGLQNFESILDADQSFVKKYTLKVTPEALVLDQNGDTIYKGRINDGYYAPGKMKRNAFSNDLSSAIDSWLNHKKKLEIWEEAVGCFITIIK